MKTKIITLLWCFAAGITGLLAQDKKTDTIKVYGNCGMCKTTIESSLSKKDGIISKNWNKDTKKMVVTYDPSKTNIKQIGEKIASVGYDNEYATAPDKAYSSLHSCCQYDRPKKDK